MPPVPTPNLLPMLANAMEQRITPSPPCPICLLRPLGLHTTHHTRHARHKRRARTQIGIESPQTAPNPDKQGTPGSWQSQKTPQNVGISPPPKHPKTTPITLFRAIGRGLYLVFRVKSEYPNAHPLDTFRFATHTQTHTQVHTQTRKTPVLAPFRSLQNAKTA